METTVKKIEVKVQGVYLNKFDDNDYQTISLRLNKPIKIMRADDNGDYKEDSTNFLSMPLSAAFDQMQNDTINYFIGVTSPDEHNLRIALSSAKLVIDECLVPEGETVKGFGENTTDHDQYFHVIASCTPTKLGKAVIAASLGVDASVFDA